MGSTEQKMEDLTKTSSTPKELPYFNLRRQSKDVYSSGVTSEQSKLNLDGANKEIEDKIKKVEDALKEIRKKNKEKKIIEREISRFIVSDLDKGKLEKFIKYKDNDEEVKSLLDNTQDNIKKEVQSQNIIYEADVLRLGKEYSEAIEMHERGKKRIDEDKISEMIAKKNNAEIHAANALYTRGHLQGLLEEYNLTNSKYKAFKDKYIENVIKNSNKDDYSYIENIGDSKIKEAIEYIR